MQPKTIEVFLPEGEPTGVRIAEIKNRTVQLIAFPRKQLNNVNLIDREGIYFLFGTDEDKGDRPLVYIGQAKNCFIRIKQHHQDPKKDFWNTAAVFITKDQSFGTTEIEYLEQLAVAKAQATTNYVVKNGNLPPSSTLSQSQKSQLEEIFDCLQLLLPVIGYQVFAAKSVSDDSNDILFCKGTGVVAKGIYIDEGMKVLKGSHARNEVTPTLAKGVIKLRERLLEQGILKITDKATVFNEDYIFSSPSMAADVILGRSENGWRVWKDRDNHTLDEIAR